MRSLLGRALAVAFAVLLVTSTAGPALAAQPWQSDGIHQDRYSLFAQIEESLIENGNSVERKGEAVGLLRNLDVGKQGKRLNRSISRLNGTLDAYRDGTRVDSGAVFRDDAKAVRDLAKFAKTADGERLDLATNLAAGDTTEAALDAAGLIPVLGKPGDVVKAGKVIVKWTGEFASKAKFALRVLETYAVRYAPDSANRAIYDAFGHGEKYRILRQGLTSNEVKGLVDKLPEGETLGDVRHAVKHGDEILYLSEKRWQHIVSRHIEGSIGQAKARTDFFPMGETISASGRRTAKDLPETMSEGQARELIMLASRSKKTDPLDTSARVYDPVKNGFDYGIDNLRVIVDGDGRIITAYPDSGEAVWRWSKRAGEWIPNPEPRFKA